MTSTTGHSALLERETAVTAVEETLRDARAGQGGALLVLGSPGVGKTSLLSAAARSAGAQGMRVLTARGAQLEQDFAFGAVRQLFGVAAEDPTRRAELFSGPGALAEAALAGEPTLLSAPDAAHAAYHGLYWLMVNLASEPLLLAIDDAQWLDSPSLGWLEYAIRRLAGTSVALLVGSRPVGDHSGDLVPLAADPATRRIGLTPLTPVASTILTRAHFGQHANDPFCRACHEVTGGNPFFLRELHQALAARGLDPVTAAPDEVREVAPRTVAESILSRVAGLGDETGRLARAAAVLDTDFRITDAAELAGLDRDGWVRAADRLVAAEILDPSASRFVHPIVRRALYESLPPVQRSVDHDRAARLLAGRPAERDQVAAHLSATQPAGDAWVVDQLHAAADRARRRGAPSVAAHLLERALREPPPPSLTFELLGELGDAEMQFDPEAGRRHLLQALESTGDPVQKAPLAVSLGHALILNAECREAFAVAESAAAELPDSGSDDALALEMIAMLAAACETSLAGRKFGRALELSRLRGETLGERWVLGQVAFYAMCAGLPPSEVSVVVERATGGRFSAAGVPVATFSPTLALVEGDMIEQATEMLELMLGHASAIGSSLWFTLALALRAENNYRRGQLRAAEEDAQRALSLMPRQAPSWGAIALAALLRSQANLGRPQDAVSAYARWEQADWLRGTAWAAILGEAHAYLELALGRASAARAELLEAGRVMDALGMRNPAPVGWRAGLSLAHTALGEAADARTVAERNLELARQAQTPRSLGIALRVAAEAGEQVDLARLEESAAVLAGSGAELEMVRTAVAIGAAERRAGARRAAGDRLRDAALAADRLGAVPLAQVARDELRLLGLRPRRVEAAGATGLSPSELRVAQLAAQGMSNKAIAQRIFVTVNTVQTHLSRTYTKLGISGRHELAAQLGESATSASTSGAATSASAA